MGKAVKEDGPGQGLPSGSLPAGRRVKREVSKGSYFAIGATVLLVSWVGFLASFSGLFAVVGLDSLLEARFLNYLAPFERASFSREVEVILINENEETAGPQAGSAHLGLRSDHALLIDTLAQAGASVIAFDFFFETASPEHDPEFARAIRRLRTLKPPTSVIVGAIYGEGDEAPVVTLSPTLKSELKRGNWGLIDVGWARARMARVSGE